MSRHFWLPELSHIGLDSLYVSLLFKSGSLNIAFAKSFFPEPSVYLVTQRSLFISRYSSCFSVPVLKTANSIQRIKKDPSLNELQPPPYPEERKTSSSSRSRSDRGVTKASSRERCHSPQGSSEGSEDPDTESYLNKGCDEDIPSDSTAVLGPEVRGMLCSHLYAPVKVTLWITLSTFSICDVGIYMNK